MRPLPSLRLDWGANLPWNGRFARHSVFTWPYWAWRCLTGRSRVIADQLIMTDGDWPLAGDVIELRRCRVVGGLTIKHGGVLVIRCKFTGSNA